MKLFKAFKHALSMVLNSKLRSWLTILGIVIGVAAVIAITSIGEGLKAEINSQLGELGGDILTITAGGGRAFGGFRGAPGEGGGGVATEDEIVLDRTDLQALKGLSDVKFIDTNIRANVDAYYLGKKGSVSLTGVDPAVWLFVTTKSIDEGRMLGPADSNVIVIGGRFARDFFDSPVGINQMLTLNDRSFRVVGILDDESTSIFMPISVAYDLLDDKDRDVYDSLVIKVKNEDELDAAIANIEEKLSVVRHVSLSKKNFNIMSNKENQERRAEMVSSMTVFLTAIAAVALLVGAVGIANTMFTSVLEKTKQIGIMKAIGARNKDILVIFLLNAALIGLIGGVLGVIAGYFLSGLMPALMGSGMPGRFSAGALVSWQSVVAALGISVFIGMLSGIIPAYKASKLKPVDALRWE